MIRTARRRRRHGNVRQQQHAASCHVCCSSNPPAFASLWKREGNNVINTACLLKRRCAAARSRHYWRGGRDVRKAQRAASWQAGAMVHMVEYVAEAELEYGVACAEFYRGNIGYIWRLNKRNGRGAIPRLEGAHHARLPAPASASSARRRNHAETITGCQGVPQ